MWYSRILCHHPYAVLSTVIVVIATCLALSLTAKPLPSFTDPALGFESRGTVISERATAWENLLESTNSKGPLIVNPLGNPHYKPPKKPERDAKSKHRHKVCIEKTSTGSVEVKENCTEIDNKTRVALPPTEETSFDVLRDLSQFRDETGDPDDDDDDPFDYKWAEFDTENGDKHPHSQPDESSNHEHHEHVGPDGFFCNRLVPAYGHVVVGSKSPIGTLLTFAHLRSICQVDQLIRSVPEFKTICQTSSGTKCCPSWSLPNYFAFLSNKTSCLDLTGKDVTNVYKLLRRCARFFDLQLEGGCGVASCAHIPKVCLDDSAVYTILHYLTDAAFLQPQTGKGFNRQSKTSSPIGGIKKPRLSKVPNSPHSPQGQRNHPSGPIPPPPANGGKTTSPPVVKQRHHLQHLGQRQQEDKLSLTAIFLPIARSSKTLPYFEAIYKRDLTVRNMTVLAMDLGLKNTLFDKLLLSDSFLLGVGGGVVVLLIWFYTGSLFITVITITTVACSLLIAYFLYVFIYEIAFFPYMNVLTAVIAIGLGADDTFVYCRVWNLAKQDKTSVNIVDLVSDAIDHAAASICVTSFTTAAAFLASYTSPITAIKCFSVFAGTVVLANLILMVTWVPACVVIAERWGASTCCLCVPPSPVYAESMNPKCASTCAAPLRMCYWCVETGKIFFEKILPTVIIKPRYFWIVILGSLAVCSGFVVFYYPGLRLPDTQEFQLFDREHPFEQYDLHYKYKFWFERNLRRDIVNRLPIRIVWGIQPVDNGDYLDPSSKGTLQFDETFDVSDPQSQLWLLNFCRNLRNQTFYMSTLGPLLPNCFIETFKVSMERRCIDPTNRLNRFPCCEDSRFPFTRDVFDECIHQGISELYQTPHELFIPGVAGPKFSTSTGKLKVAVVEYDSTYIWSLSYKDMNKFFNEVETWVNKQLASAPRGMKNGWFTSYLSFYDVQRSLSLGTGLAVAVAVTVCLAVLLLTTLNCIVSLLAIISVGAVMVTTLAALVLLGWRLNVLESVTVSVAIGLAIDLTLHYGVAYRLAPDQERNAAVTWAAGRLGSPVFMAALTSVSAGAAMLPARVLAYVHVGTFLTILTASSYTYSTFFYLPLLRICGPQHGFGQFSYPTFASIRRCFEKRDEEEVDGRSDKAVYQQAFMSESTLSTSSNCFPNTTTTTAVSVGGGAASLSDTHELEPLTTNRRSSSSNRKRHPSVSRIKSAGGGVPMAHQQQDASCGTHHHGGGSKKCSRSGSLSCSSLSSRRERALRKVSLPSPGDEKTTSPRHTPTSSATTILYSEPDSEMQRMPHSPSYLQYGGSHFAPSRQDSYGSQENAIV